MAQTVYKDGLWMVELQRPVLGVVQRGGVDGQHAKPLVGLADLHARVGGIHDKHVAIVAEDPPRGAQIGEACEREASTARRPR